MAWRNRITRETSRFGADIKQDEIDEKAWKYTGYPGFSRVVASDPDYFVLRRFDTLNARVLLALQDNIAELEEQLEQLDLKYSSKDADDVNNGTVRDELPDRANVMAKISSKLQEYNTLVQSYSSLRSRPPPLKRQIRNVDRWLNENNVGAIMPEEAAFIQHKSDLLSVCRDEKPSLRSWLEEHVVFKLPWLFAAAAEAEEAQRGGEGGGKLDVSETTVYGNDTRIELLAISVTLLTGVALLVAPIWILAFANSYFAKLAIITAFIVVFLTSIQFATTAKPAEALAATAAYSAVLMVFIQLGNPT